MSPEVFIVMIWSEKVAPMSIIHLCNIS